MKLGFLRPLYELRRRSARDRLAADGAAMAETAEDITTRYSERTVVSRLGTWHSPVADSTAVAGLAATLRY
jgi:hypothetical protein